MSPGASGPGPRKSLQKKSRGQSKNTLQTLSGDSPETSQTIPETFRRLFWGPEPEAPRDIFETLGAFRAWETPVSNGGLVPKTNTELLDKITLPKSVGELIRTFVTGEHWTGSPNKRIDQIGKNCPKIVLKIVFPAPPDNFWTFFGQFFGIFRTFCRHSLLSGLSNDLPVTKLGTVFVPNGTLWFKMITSRKNSELFAIGPVQCSWPCGVAENWFTKPGFWEYFVGFFS